MANNKYTRRQKYISTDGGLTFNPVTPPEYIKGELIEVDSVDCGAEVITWVPVEGVYICENYVPTPYSAQYLTTEALGSGKISLRKGGVYSNNWEPLSSIQYSKNGGSWTAYTYKTGISVVTGDKIRWKAKKNRSTSTDLYSYFSATADYKVYGNPLSLLKNNSFVDEPDTIYKNAYYRLFYEGSTLRDASGLALPATTLAENCYEEIFKGCTSLTTAPELPATILASACYRSMFSGCTSLTTAPAILPAMTLAEFCYEYMFSGCTSLTTAPELSATRLQNYCCEYMFSGCTSLTTAPAILPATSLGRESYYGMFKGCTSLTTAPELPATGINWGCYQEMFSGCTSLTTAPELPATSVSQKCYREMFSGCTSLTTAPKLPATILFEGCYYGMFKGCTSLKTAPELPATTLLGDECCRYMFYGCTSLTTAPAILPATTLTRHCYSYMFKDCTSLTTALELPATTLAFDCYDGMFSGCSSLTTAPAILPATRLQEYCYTGMFIGCTSLTTAPVLPATTLVEYCYSYIFKDCASLNSVTCCATDISSANCTYHWVENVASTGTFHKDANATWSTGVSGIPSGWTTDTCGCEPAHDYSTQYLTTEALGDGNISLKKEGTESGRPLTNIQYSKNGGAWTSYTYDTNISVVTGDKIRWKGTLKDGNHFGYYSRFYSTVDYKVYGNPLSLLNNDSFVDEPGAIYEYAYLLLFENSSTLKDISGLALPATTLASHCYEWMFEKCTSLTTALELPATTMAAHCYANMFSGCTSLTTAPALPATALAEYCYTHMFAGCTSLTTAPALPATTLAYCCYLYMFGYCTSLTSAPALPATTLAVGCYEEMFWYCTSLTTAPTTLPATTLTEDCYLSMFQGCTSLISAPVLPATTLCHGCYDSMFLRTSLISAPVLPATTLAEYCYNKMFYECTSLNSITCLATDISATDCTKSWLYNVASTGTFVKASSMTGWTRGNASGIPYRWTVQDA